MDRKSVLSAVQKALEQGKGKRKFTQSVELAVNLQNLDLSIPKNRIDEEVLLPKGRGRAPKIAVFATGELASRAKKVADLVIPPEEIEKIAGDKRRAKKLANEYQFFLAEAPLMPTIGKTLGQVLGPRGKMPRALPPNADPTNVVNNLRNSVRVRSRDRPTFHTAVGTEAMSPDDLADNAHLVLERIQAKLERGRFNLGSVYVKTSMGPAVKVMEEEK
jgi:large subunit ribosomal protein L1